MKVLVATTQVYWEGDQKASTRRMPDLSRHLIQGEHQKRNPVFAETILQWERWGNLPPQKKSTLLKKIFCRKQK